MEIKLINPFDSICYHIFIVMCIGSDDELHILDRLVVVVYRFPLHRSLELAPINEQRVVVQ